MPKTPSKSRRRQRPNAAEMEAGGAGRRCRCEAAPNRNRSAQTRCCGREIPPGQGRRARAVQQARDAAGGGWLRDARHSLRRKVPELLAEALELLEERYGRVG